MALDDGEGDIGESAILPAIIKRKCR